MKDQPLRLICLNTWAGMVGADLFTFFERHQEVDIFCLQEVYNAGEQVIPTQAAGRSLLRVDRNLFQNIEKTLPEYQSFYTAQVSCLGIAIFFRKNLRVVRKGDLCIYREPGFMSTVDIADHARVLQYITFETAQGLVTVLNTHAAWQPIGKIDTPERLDQSQRIIAFTKQFSEPLILCGDFNLLPTTQSIQLLEEAGWRNLIRTHGILSTRTRLYEKEERFADYIFTKNNVQVQEFRVLPEEVSDHAALFLECSLGKR